jgi:hypothetical protein
VLLREVGELPATLNTAQLADLTGVDARVWWEVARGEAEASIPVVPIRVGRRGVLRWPTAPVLDALGLSRSGQATATSGPTPRDSYSNGPTEEEPGAAA